MTTQRLHTNLAPIDLLTREEHEQVMHKELDAALREKVRGLDIMRVPVVPITAIAATVPLFTTNDMQPWGPEQGDVWMVRRVCCKSNVLTDTAKWVLYRGSSPSDVANAYTFRQQLDLFIGGATPGQNVGVGEYFTSKTVWLQPGEQIYAQVLGATIGNQYLFDAEALRVPAEMKGKLIG
jgi:hypothetical protein